ncbi:MAG TPA: hypothetical protein VM943_02420 [Pyrinomonadaceae bacterium]|nr:hypothetical protein [Pyrinomonadaceae bacterium]
MNAYDNPLDNVKVAAPCPANWDNMCGNEQVRFCGQCNLNVYNLSGMTRHEAEAFVARAEGRVCVRFFRRVDGTVLTENCPVGLRALKKRMSGVAKAAVSTVMGFFAGLGFNAAFSGNKIDEPTGVMGRIAVELPLPDQSYVMGDMVIEEAPSTQVPPQTAKGHWVNGGMYSLPSTVTTSDRNHKR